MAASAVRAREAVPRRLTRADAGRFECTSGALVGLGELVERGGRGVECRRYFGDLRHRPQRLNVRARRVERLRDSCYRAIGRLSGDGVTQLRSAQIEHGSFRDPRRRIKGPGVERTGRGGGVTLPEEECCGGNCNEEQTQQDQASHTTLHETLL